MRFTDVLATANQNLWRNKLRSILTILAIFIGAFTIVLTTGINTGVNDYIDKQLESVGGEDYINIVPESVTSNVASQMGIGSNSITEYSPDGNTNNMESISQDDLKKIRSVEGIKSADVYSQINVEYITSKETDKKFNASVNRMPTDTINVDMAYGKMVSLDAGQYQIALAPDYASELGFASDNDAVGNKVAVGVKNIASGKIEEVVAIVTGIQNASIMSMSGSWINNSFYDELYNKQTSGAPEYYKPQAFVATGQLELGLTKEQIHDVKDALLEHGFVVTTLDDEVGMMKTFFDAITIVLTIFGIIALLAAVIGIVNTLFMAVQERTREIGLMKAMGLAPSTIRMIFNLEAILLGFWGSLLGILFGLIMAHVANTAATETFLAGLPGFTLIMLEPFNMIIFTLSITFVAFLAGSLPARRASRLDPIEALRYE